MAQSREAQDAPLAEFNVIGVFPDMVAARKAMDALERAGIDAVHISLLGPRAEEASSRADTRERDENVAVDVGKRTGIGAAAGAAAGGIAGLIAGAVAFAIPGVGPVIGAGLWAAAWQAWQTLIYRRVAASPVSSTCGLWQVVQDSASSLFRKQADFISR